MANIILWERADGGISYGCPVPGRESRMIEQWEKSLGGRNARRLPDRDEAELTTSEFRNAWRANPDGTIKIDSQVKQQIIEAQSPQRNIEQEMESLKERIITLETKQR